MSRTIIQIRNLYKLFGPVSHKKRAMNMLLKGASKEEILKKTKTAVGVSDVNLDIYEGETLVIMGLSGSGKSTLLRCLNLLHKPSSGQVIVEGEDITQFDSDAVLEFRRKKFGMVFQKFALFPHKTILENTEFGLEIQNVPKEVRSQKAIEALDLVGLKGWENYYPSQLSGGMQQRVGLARALAVEPDILLMDEAFSALDPLIRNEMQDELLSLESSVQKTIIFVTHDLDEALKIGDRIVLMKDGKIVQIGTPEDILSNPANLYVEKFVENVDITKVLTAKDLMAKRPPIIVPKDGPRMALRKMREEGDNYILVVNRKKEFVGILRDDDVSKAIEKGEKDVEYLIQKEGIVSIAEDMPFSDLLPLAVDSDHPLIVINEKNQFKGIVAKSSILSGLADHSRGGDE